MSKRKASVTRVNFTFDDFKHNLSGLFLNFQEVKLLFHLIFYHFLKNVGNYLIYHGSKSENFPKHVTYIPAESKYFHRDKSDKIPVNSLLRLFEIKGSCYLGISLVLSDIQSIYIYIYQQR